MALLSFLNAGTVEAGCDEAGRGALVGAVFAAAVVLPPDYQHPLLNDSKLLSEKQRAAVRRDIEADAMSYAVATASAAEIDAINILQASFLAMHRAIAQLTHAPNFLLIDGNRFKPFRQIPFACIVKGDSKFASIAAASVLAKTHRDDYMQTLHAQYPQYGWDANKGYPTQAHRNAIAQYGACPLHRQSFRLLNPAADALNDSLFPSSNC